METETKAYAGIGSRETPVEVLETMRKIAAFLAGKGYTLRSGAAPGADSAFEQGAVSVGGKTEIWVPWRGFNGRRSALVPTPEAFALAEQHHPAWAACKQGAKALHARNGHQVLGASLRDPVEFIVCWTKGGTGAGGTGQALRIARSLDIEVYDLGGSGELERLRYRFGIGPKPEIHAIRGFEGNYRWLSNFIGHPNEPTVEHRYQAAKAIDPAGAEAVLAAPTAAAAKKMGRTITVRPDWDAVKLETMRTLLQDKFSREPFRSKLIATGEAEIVEENHWGDTFWGVCRGSGENHLGRLLMDLRREFQSQ
jgi:ribA/ribD-fused uncharacterized protein